MIGIPAYNEEKNIALLLGSIFDQKLHNFHLAEIVIYSDASTDKTDEIVLKLGKLHPIIKLERGLKRKGKYLVLNDIFSGCKSDVLVTLDADIIMQGCDFIEKILSVLIRDTRAQMIASHNIFVKPDGFIARLIYTHFYLWDVIQLSMPSLDSAGHFSGTATAFRGSYARTLRIPESVSNPHSYLYLASRKRDGFRYCADAHILQKLPSTIKEVKTLYKRAIAGEDEKLDTMFGRELITKSRMIPRSAKIKGLVKCFSKYPLSTPLAIILGIYLNKIDKSTRKDSKLWTINNSTKILR